jgi:hypothetical protein
MVRQLRLLRYGPDNRASVRGWTKGPAYSRRENGAGLSVYRAIWQGRISDRSQSALSRALIICKRRLTAASQMGIAAVESAQRLAEGGPSD